MIKTAFKDPPFEVPPGWRHGQFCFNFLEWLKNMGYAGNQSYRLADTFHLSDEEFDELWRKFVINNSPKQSKKKK